MADSEKIHKLAEQVVSLAHDHILMHLRFFDRALARLEWRERPHMGCMATDGSSCFYDPVYVLRLYRREPEAITRMYLHILLHCIFSHGFQYQKLDREKWDLAADIAVENVILDMGLPGTALETDQEADRKRKVWQEEL